MISEAYFKVKHLASLYATQRILTAGFVFAVALIASWSLGPERYGALAFSMFIAKFLRSLSLGSASGYLYNRFNGTNEDVADQSFTVYYGAHLLIGGAILFIGAIFIGPIYIFGVMCFMALVPWYVNEPVFRIHRLFFASLAPDLVLNFSALIVSIVSLYLGSAYALKKEYVLCAVAFLVLVLSLATIVPMKRKHQVLQTGEHRLDLKSYIQLVQKGFPLYLATLGFLGLISIDRVFLETAHPSESLGIYMLAYQLALGATLLLTAFNFVSVIDYGEKIRDQKTVRTLAIQRVIRSAVTALLSVLMVFLLAYAMETYFLTEYKGLAWHTLMLSVGLCTFHVAGSISPVAFFRNRQLPLTLLLLSMLPLALAHNALVLNFNLPHEWLSFLTGMWLSVYGVCSLIYVAMILKNEKSEQ